MTFISKIYLKIENKIASYENAVFICRVVKKNCRVVAVIGECFYKNLCT